MPTGSPPGQQVRRDRDGLRWNAWNLFLLVPLLMLITPVFNREEPRVLGLPFFYWYQFLFVPLGVVCVAIVYVKTKDKPARTGGSDRLQVDDSDEGDAR